jgi:hypothetical protein
MKGKWVARLIGSTFVMLVALSVACSPSGNGSLDAVTVYTEITQIIPDEWRHAKYRYPSSRWKFDFDKKRVFRGHLSGSFEVCAESSEFICMSWDALPFVVPRNEDFLENGWKYGGREYIILNESIDISIFGESYSVVVFFVEVESAFNEIDNPDKYIFYYSYDIGLIMFSQEVVDCDAVDRDLLEGQSACELGGIFVVSEGKPIFSRAMLESGVSR